MTRDMEPAFLDAGRQVREVQLALSFVNDALDQLAALQAARQTMDPQAERAAWVAGYREAWAYFARSHEAYASRAAALLAMPPPAPS